MNNAHPSPLLRLTFVLLLGVWGLACQEESGNTQSSDSQSTLSSTEEGATITEIDTGNTSSGLSDYTQASFSQYIYFHLNEDKTLIDYNFFPEGSDLCSQATYDVTSNPGGCKTDKTIVIPCDYQESSQDDVLSIDAEGETKDCTEDIVLTIASATFSVDGLVFNSKDSITVFAEEFEFTITTNGFIDSDDGSLLDFSSTDITLTDVYDFIMDKRTSS